VETGCLSVNSIRDAALLVCNSQLIKALTRRHDCSVTYSVKRYSEFYFQKKFPKFQQLLISVRSEPGCGASPSEAWPLYRKEVGIHWPTEDKLWREHACTSAFT